MAKDRETISGEAHEISYVAKLFRPTITESDVVRAIELAGNKRSDVYHLLGQWQAQRSRTK